VERRGRAMGAYLAGHSLGLAMALVLAGIAIPRGGYVLAFWWLACGPVVGGVFAWRAVRPTANVVTPRAGGQRFGGEVLKNRPAMLVIAGYTFHSWERSWACGRGRPRSSPRASWRRDPTSPGEPGWART